jgi:hypothetical protein
MFPSTEACLKVTWPAAYQFGARHLPWVSQRPDELWIGRLSQGVKAGAAHKAQDWQFAIHKAPAWLLAVDYFVGSIVSELGGRRSPALNSCNNDDEPTPPRDVL